MGEAREPRRAQERDQSHQARLPCLRQPDEEGKERIDQAGGRAWKMHYSLGHVPCASQTSPAGHWGCVCRHPKGGCCPGNGSHHLQPLLILFPVNLWSHPGHQERSAIGQEAPRLRGSGKKGWIRLWVGPQKGMGQAPNLHPAQSPPSLGACVHVCEPGSHQLWAH